VIFKKIYNFLKQKIIKIKNIHFFFKIKKIDEKKLVKSIKERNLTYLSYQKLFQVLNSLKIINKKKIEGIIIEAGVALGGSLILLKGYSEGRRVIGFDTFEMIPPPTVNDPQEVHERYKEIVSGESKGINGDIYYGYQSDLLNFVSAQLHELTGSLNQGRVLLIKGLLQDTFNVNESIAFAHIDVDWYESVKCATSNIWPLLSKEGVIIFDDYFDWGGCKKAVDEFFSDKNDYKFDASLGSLKVTKLKF